MGRRNLVVIRAGNRPYCQAWGQLSARERDWDCYVNYYGTADIVPSIGQELTFRYGITKFFGIAEFFEAMPDALQGYDAFLFLDDDIEIEPVQINEFFDVFHKNRLLLAQPSLHPGSFFNHKLTIHDHRYVLRYTRFVEIMMPAFSRAALVLCLPTFRMSVSGWGLDYLWPRCLSFPYKGIAIVDAVVVGHTKQSDPQQGEFYRMLRRFNVDAHAEHDEIVRMHGIDTSYHHQAYGGIRRLNLWKRAFRRLNRCRASGEERQIRENQ